MNPSAPDVKDLYNSKERYQYIRTYRGVTPENKAIIERFLADMEIGRNVASQKGQRSYLRLMSLYYRMAKLSILFEQHAKKNLSRLDEDDVLRVFFAMRKGDIKKSTGKAYSSVQDYVKIFKSFWHWRQKTERKENKKELPDITIDLDASKEKPKFHYLTFEQVKRICDSSKYEYRVLFWTAFDTGARVTELFNLRACDITFKAGEAEANIRQETAKTFGRKVKLLLAVSMLKEYVANQKLKPRDFLFSYSPVVVNQYLARMGEKLFGIGAVSKKDGHHKTTKHINDGLTIYDLRHSSACYWLTRYKSENALKYRFGWKKSEEIHYYTELLGMKDTINQSDLIDSDGQSQLQKELQTERQRREVVEAQLQAMTHEMAGLKSISEKLLAKYEEMSQTFSGLGAIQAKNIRGVRKAP